LTNRELEASRRADAERRRKRFLVAIAALGPGILGLMADNDAGGMTSYLLTGARHQLALFLPALGVMGLVTLFVQDMALRVALVTRTPFARLVESRFGRLWSRLLATLIHGLNLLVLATEISGMAMALTLTGLGFAPAAVAATVLVMAITSLSRYRTLERVLLLVAILNLAFLGAVFALPAGPTVTDPFHWQAGTTGLSFYLLALAGNAMAPWMVYWQQNAVVARGMKAWEIRRGRFDLGVGVMAQMTMATVVLWTGASLRGNPARFFNPLAWMARQGGHVATGLFAVGLFDAGLLAAVAISQSSQWMLREAFRPASSAGPRHACFGQLGRLWLPLALILVLVPGWGQGFLALFTQALAALLMPVTIAFLGMLGNDPAVAGPLANRGWQRWAWPLVAALFVGIALAMGLGG
jgi:Mn2+/Fe2+ NRAMP family transporter